MNDLTPVSCIMPTFNRRHFVSYAIRYFLYQNYHTKELIIVDDGTDPIEDLVPNGVQFKYIRLQKKISIGAKRNLAVAESQAQIILHWDDDDWYAPYRIRYQVEHLIKNQADICGNNRMLFYDLGTNTLWLYEFPMPGKIWLAGGSLCYTKSFWEKHKFDDTNFGEDTRFVWKKPLGNAMILPDFKFYVAMIHSGNTSPKSLSPPCWKRWRADKIQNLMKEDWHVYSTMRT
jgi:glycosyltransferase involved in cell wall biosynthesis